jgi:hypothetical protein
MSKLAKIDSLFGKPEDLDNNWIINHKDHSLCWMNHTVFDKKEKTGRKFRECICYTCRKVAQQLLGEVGETLAPVAEKKKRPTKSKKKRIDVVAFGGY